MPLAFQKGKDFMVLIDGATRLVRGEILRREVGAENAEKRVNKIDARLCC